MVTAFFKANVMFTEYLHQQNNA